MKLSVIAIKIAFVAILIILLANCSSVYQVREQAKIEPVIIVTGSRVQAEELQNYNSNAREKIFRIIEVNPRTSGQIFKRYRVNPTIQTRHNPISTFSMDVDKAAYKLANSMLKNYQLPNPDGIRIEEFVNALDYQYNQNDEIFSISAEAMPSPFRTGYHILHLGLQTKTLNDNQRNPSNIVMVADVSGSMASDNKLELLKNAMITLVSQLNSDDRIALVVYNEDASVVIKPTKASNKRKIFKAINKLRAGGSTNAEKGLLKGYKLAEMMFQPGFNNRVILTSDGMANVGSTSPEAILAKIKTSREKGIFLTTLGVGREMYNDHLLEQLANQGNGNYLYIADQKDIQQAFVDELTSQLQTVAKDAKIQLKFNPDMVSNYRLLGYENRHLKQEDFSDPDKDGGEIGAGHKVTALYEIRIKNLAEISTSSIANLTIAYKKPLGYKQHYISKEIPLSVVRNSVKTASPDSILSFGVAAFAEKLRQSYWARLYSYDDIELILNNLPYAYKRQAQVINLRKLIQMAQNLDSRADIFGHYPIQTMNFDRVPLLD